MPMQAACEEGEAYPDREWAPQAGGVSVVRGMKLGLGLGLGWGQQQSWRQQGWLTV